MPKIVARLCLALAALLAGVLPGAVCAADEAPARTRVVLLGTAGGPPLRPDRSQPAAALVVDGRLYLIDAGTGTVRRMVEAGLRPEQTRAIFITHHHPDHDLGLAGVLANALYSRTWASTGPWSIYGPPGTRTMTDAALRYLSTPYGVFRAEGLTGPEFGAAAGGERDLTGAFYAALKARRLFRAHDVGAPGEIYRDDEIRVIAARNTHYAQAPAAALRNPAMQSFAYRIETPDRVVVFTGDTGPSEEVTQLAHGADLLVSEILEPGMARAAMQALAAQGGIPPERAERYITHLEQEHLSPEALGALATRAGVKAVVLTHFVPGGRNQGDYERYAADVRRFYAGRVVLGADLLDVPF
ncbi:MAG TPA: MBL fold metallo-hydrolase [Caulobacteraceae bacterium]|nr:MBL fold metallo-hydrolase [Caulobacteraceae bacterium]